MLKQGDILKLSDNKDYSIAYMTQIDGHNYLYLVDHDDYTNTMVCVCDNDNSLEEVVEPEIIEKLLYKFVNN